MKKIFYAIIVLVFLIAAQVNCIAAVSQEKASDKQKSQEVFEDTSDDSDEDYPNILRMPPIAVAVMIGSLEQVKEYIDDGSTALLIAESDKNKEIIKILEKYLKS